VKMVFVKEESEEDMSEPEPWRIKHEEQEGRWSHMPIYTVLFFGCTNMFPSRIHGLSKHFFHRTFSVFSSSNVYVTYTI